LNTLNPLEKKRFVLNKSVARRFKKINNHNLWDDFNDRSDKRRDLYLMPEVLKKEDQAVEVIKGKIKD
jgi:hypothetical protein